MKLMVHEMKKKNLLCFFIVFHWNFRGVLGENNLVNILGLQCRQSDSLPYVEIMFSLLYVYS